MCGQTTRKLQAKITISMDVANHLTSAGIKPTASRILVYKVLEESAGPLSLMEIESSLGTVDKSQVSRALSLFMEHALLHKMEGPDGVAKYELCHCGEEGDHLHIHFFCEKCKRMICLDDHPIKKIQLPEGFSAHTASYVISGICPDCK